MRKTFIGFAGIWTLAAVCASGGCHNPGGGITSSPTSSLTYYSTERMPKVVTLIDTRTEEEIFRIEVPVGKQLSLDFVEGRGDDPVYRPDLMRYEILALGSRYGRLRNAMTVPNAWSRRIDWYLRDAPEYAEPPPSERYRIDRYEERPAWWTPEGGPLPSDSRWRIYDR